MAICQAVMALPKQHGKSRIQAHLCVSFFVCYRIKMHYLPVPSSTCNITITNAKLQVFFYMNGKCLSKSHRLYKTDGHSHKNINSLLMDFHFTVEGWSLAFGPSPWRFIGVRSDHIWMIWKWVLSYELMLASLDRKLHSKTHRSLSIHQKVTLKLDHTHTLFGISGCIF